MDGNVLSPADQPIPLEPIDVSVIAMVPIEMYRNVFRFIGNQDLTALSRVSRSFQYEAEHILYDFVDLTLGNHRMRIVSWCNAVISVERRAHRVHTLRFPAHLPILSGVGLLAELPNDETVQKMVAHAFSVTVNLEHLLIFGHSTIRVAQSASINISTLASCTFSLSSFAGQALGSTTQEQIDFLLKHPNIKYWVPTEPFLQSIESLPQDMLPHLRETMLVRPSFTKALKNRPLEALVLMFISASHSRTIGLEAIKPLAFMGDTLHTLEYTHGSLGMDWSTADLIDTLSRTTPNLRTLTLKSLIKDDSVVSPD